MSNVPEDFKKKQMSLWQSLFDRYNSRDQFYHVGCNPDDLTKIYVGVQFKKMARDIKRVLLDEDEQWEGLDVEFDVVGKPRPLGGEE